MGAAAAIRIFKVRAATPKAAALEALSEELHTIGEVRRLRARVIAVDAIGFLTTATFYSKI